MELTGTSLGERQKQLNEAVNYTASINVEFDEVKAQNEAGDADKLFKIDVASKYKKIDYIIQVLKCGDSLYVTRALKCTWLYDDAYTDFINPDYLQDNVFPFMSMKMKKKMLSSISMYVRDESRAARFYIFCKFTLKLSHFAEKFLLFTSESFKLKLINDDIASLNSLRNSEDNLRNFLGNSFELVDAYLGKAEEPRHDILYALRHLYSISDAKYLDLLEKHYIRDEEKCQFTKRLGLRTSKEIMNKHKLRLYNHLLMYAAVLNISMFVKYTSVAEAKRYAARLLPVEYSTFWNIDFCERYDFIINILPFEERYRFIRTIFTEKYIGKEFEMDIKFYNLKYYELLSVDEKEAWALRHIKDKKELLGKGEDFQWYKFLNFEKAFTAIIKYASTDPNSKRNSRFFIVLVETIRNDRDVEKLLNYFYKNYGNENVYYTRLFIEKVVETLDVYNFDNKCWTAFEKLFFCLSDVYNRSVHDINPDEEYRYIGLFYHMLHKTKFPDSLLNFMNTEACFWGIKKSESFAKLNEDRQTKIYEIVLQFYVDKMKELDNETDDEDVQLTAQIYVYYITNHLKLFGRNEENDCPEIVKQYKELYKDFYYQWPMLTQNDLLRHLKEDIDIIVSKFHIMEHNCVERSVRRFKLKQFLRKLKIYFANDFAQEVLEFFTNMFSHGRYVFRPKRITSAVVFAIFHLADEEYKREFLANYSPTNGIIDEYPYVQQRRREAIRRFACYSRPPIPLSDLKPYIQEENLKFNLPMLNYYMSNLPLPLLEEFVETLLSFPPPILTHGLRLAFKVFSTGKLKQHIIEAWDKSKDVSLRKVIYTYLHKRVNDNDEDQNELFDVLKMFTINLSENDHQDVINLMFDSDKMLAKLRGQFIEAVLEALAKFADTAENVVWKITTVNNMNRNCYLMDKCFLESFIKDKVLTILSETFVFTISNHYYYSVLCRFHEAKWDLAATCFIKLNNDEDNLKWILNSLKLIMKQFREKWTYVDETKNIPATCFSFLSTLTRTNFECEREKCVNSIPIFETVLKELQESYPSRDIYLLEWSVQLTIIANKALRDVNMQNVAAAFGTELGNLVKKLVDSKNIFYSFDSKIVEIINTRLSYIARVMGNSLGTLYDIHALVGIKLLEFGIMETDLLATEMLSFQSCPSNNWHNDLLEKLQKIERSEVKSMLQQRCLDGGAKFSLPLKKTESTIVYNKNMDNTLVFVLDP